MIQPHGNGVAGHACCRGASGADLENLREFVETNRMKENVGPQAFADIELHRGFMVADRDVIRPRDNALRHGGRRSAHRRQGSRSRSAAEDERRRSRGRAHTLQESHQCRGPLRQPGGADARRRRGGFGTKWAAQQGVGVVTQVTPQNGVNLYRRAGNMTPSKSTLRRLPR
jgi:hypothetical protein